MGLRLDCYTVGSNWSPYLIRYLCHLPLARFKEKLEERSKIKRT